MRTDSAQERNRDKRFHKVRLIDEGTFGKVYLGIDTETNEDVAIKVASPKISRAGVCRFLKNEVEIYQNIGRKLGMCRLRWFGLDGSEMILVFELLGASLEELFSHCGQKFSLKTTLMIADQMVSRIEMVHNHSYIHRDIKPGNFRMGIGAKENVLHILNFSLAKRYKLLNCDSHIRCLPRNSLSGSPRFKSYNAHTKEQSRRDDLESVGYILLHFQGKALPWQGLKCHSGKQKLECIAERKRTTKLEELCRDVHPIFYHMLKHCRELKFREKPDYSFIRQSFRKIFLQLKYEYDNEFDWTWQV